MPTLEDKANDNSTPLLLREFFYGAPKTRKTWLAGTAAEAGFNTILIDCDHGYHILLKQLSPEAKKRLYVIEAVDTIKEAVACEFMTRFLQNGRVLFNEKTKSVVRSQANLTDDCIELAVERHLDKNTVLIIDSYTALIASLKFRYAIENKVDLTSPEKENQEGYAWYGALASFFLEKSTHLPCHLIMIGHETQYDKIKQDGKKRTIEWSRRQIKSTSNPHGMTITDKFSDILYFYNVSSISTKIDTRPEKHAEGGSRIIPPNAYDWAKLQWKDICELAGIELPPKDLPYLNFKPEIAGGTQTDLMKTISPNAGLVNVEGLTIPSPTQMSTPAQIQTPKTPIIISKPK